ncbi:hypothetical protein FVR03_07580 [Pontibacter qinzhouensis]|uniref:Uncharacterized protein n=1 Tax=Pontibacter qinzhouensis TaxID=2603253 RepID=A0A5C8KC92_9BACT|nr:hypothetical protein [Pontibacter qinzhouensis]TXK48715.1 hypothetical protein FVR03_07580 [Pontibacter qinzhouensis]
MDTYNMKPENMRAPANLSKEDIQKSLEELDGKIKVLRGRAHATTADSNHTYHEHIAALEAKRELMKQKLDDTSTDHLDKWQDLRAGIDKLRNDIEGFMK